MTENATVLRAAVRLRGRSAVEGQVATHAGADGAVVEQYNRLRRGG